MQIKPIVWYLARHRGTVNVWSCDFTEMFNVM